MIVDISDKIAIDFAATGHAEIIQNVRTILGTTKFSVPLDRDFGIDATVVDRPLPVAKALITSAIFEAIERYEPRIELVQVIFDDNSTASLLDGILKPKVEVKFKDD